MMLPLQKMYSVDKYSCKYTTGLHNKLGPMGSMSQIYPSCNFSDTMQSTDITCIAMTKNFNKTANIASKKKLITVYLILYKPKL